MNQSVFVPTESVVLDYVKAEKKFNMNYQHYHDTYELYIQLDGARYVFFNGKSYIMHRGDVAVITPFELHYTSSGDIEYYERINVNLDISAMSAVLDGAEISLIASRLKPCILHLGKEQLNAFVVLYERIKHYQSYKGAMRQKLLAASVLELVAIIAEASDSAEISEAEYAENPIIDVLKYMSKNYTDDITIDFLAEKACMSKYYFCRLFKRITGATAFEYLSNIRLSQAHNLLLGDTGLTLEQIAECSGFTSSMNLSRAFKKAYGISPQKFRKQNHNPSR